MDNVITVLSGNESIPGAMMNAKLQVLCTNKRLSLVHAATSRSTTPAGRDLRREVGGELSNASYNLADGTELGLIGEQHYSSRSEIRRMLLRVDHRAPYNRVSLAGSGHDKATAPAMYIEGRFWIVDEAEVAEKVLKVFLPSYQNAHQMFSVKELHPGAVMPKVETKTINIEGEEKKVAISRPKRALRL